MSRVHHRTAAARFGRRPLRDGVRLAPSGHVATHRQVNGRRDGVMPWRTATVHTDLESKRRLWSGQFGCHLAGLTPESPGHGPGAVRQSPPQVWASTPSVEAPEAIPYAGSGTDSGESSTERRPSTPTGTSPSTVTRRSVRSWSSESSTP